MFARQGHPGAPGEAGPTGPPGRPVSHHPFAYFALSFYSFIVVYDPL